MNKKKEIVEDKLVNERPPNFRDRDGQLFLVRCFSCGGKGGVENYAFSVATGQCAWCGWKDSKEKK